MKKLIEITFEREIDEYPDLSYLGEIKYQSRKPISENKEAWIPINPNDISEGWFSPGNHLPHNIRNWDHVQGEARQQIIDKYGSLRKADIAYAYEDLHRLQEYEIMRWWMEIYTLEAHIAVSDDGEHWAHDTIRDCLGGIESNGILKEYHNEILQDMKMNLMHDLEVWGFERWEIINKLCEMEVK